MPHSHKSPSKQSKSSSYNSKFCKICRPRLWFHLILSYKCNPTFNIRFRILTIKLLITFNVLKTLKWALTKVFQVSWWTSSLEVTRRKHLHCHLSMLSTRCWNRATPSRFSRKTHPSLCRDRYIKRNHSHYTGKIWQPSRKEMWKEKPTSSIKILKHP